MVVTYQKKKRDDMVVFLIGLFGGLVIFMIICRLYYLVDCMLNLLSFCYSMQLIQIWTVPPPSLVFMTAMGVRV